MAMWWRPAGWVKRYTTCAHSVQRNRRCFQIVCEREGENLQARHTVTSLTMGVCGYAACCVGATCDARRHPISQSAGQELREAGAVSEGLEE